MSCWAVSVSAKDMPWWRSAVGSPFSSRAAELLRHGFGLPANAASGRAWIVPLRAVAHVDEHDSEAIVSGKNDSDDWLIRTCLSGDENSYAQLVERYERAVAGLLWRFTRDRLVLEELIQDTFVEVYLSLGRFRKNAPFYPWLRTIATRVGYRYWRRRKQRPDREAILEEWQRETRLVAKVEAPSDAAEHIYRLLELLEPKDRLVLTLRYFEGCSVNEIAERMGWSATLVKVRTFRARNKLRTLLLKAQQSS